MVSGNTDTAFFPAPRKLCAWIAAALLCCIVLPPAARAQRAPARRAPVQTVQFRVGRDSVAARAVMPRSPARRPAVVVLTDRFGLQPAVDDILRTLANAGYRAYALPLRSAPEQPPAGAPAARLDSADLDMLVQVVIDIRNDSACTGEAGLLAFDVGAVVGAIAQQRLPLFASCCLFYPADGAAVARVLPSLRVTTALHIGEYDGEMTLARVNDARERCIDNGMHCIVRFYKRARPFFFNPRHEHYSRELMLDAWKTLLTFFATTLR